MTLLLLFGVAAVSILRRGGVAPGGGNPLDGCQFVYLDMGTNTGVQIRKLFEPDKFPGAAVLPIFERYFGSAAGRNLSAVCAVGWEPNPAHTAYLARLQAAYRRCGWRVEIHTETGVAARQEEGQLFGRWGGREEEEGSRFVQGGDEDLLASKDNIHLLPVKTIRIAKYIKELVATRRLPNNMVSMFCFKISFSKQMK